MFPLRRRQLVVGDDFPSVRVVLIDKDAPRTLIDHRLDGERHAGHQQHARAARSAMLHIRLLMELQSDTVTAEVAHDGEAVTVGVLLDGVTQVAHKDIRLAAHLLAYFQTLPGYIDQLLLFGRRAADDEHAAGVGVVAVEDGGAVHIDDVALFEHNVLGGDAVTDDLVDAGAAALGEALIIEGRGDAAAPGRRFVDDAVDLLGGHTLADLLLNGVEYRRVKHASTTDTLNLLGRLDHAARGAQLAALLEGQNPAVHLSERLPRNQRPVGLILFTHSPKMSMRALRRYKRGPRGTC